jgi:pterin-4a-carbinolamine dehydratase
MSHSIFINYRRSDSQHAAFAIADRLKWAFGADEVFFDRGTLLAGDPWPDYIRNALDGAKVVLAIIGPNKKDERNPNGSPARPRADQRKQIPLSDSEVHAKLQEMQGWSLVWSPHPWGHGGRAQEVTKRYAFDSFGEAVAFMRFASGRIEQQKIPHHPRWENMWKVVDVYFTTWDVGCRVTRLDFDPARLFDRIYRDFIASHTQRG